MTSKLFRFVALSIVVTAVLSVSVGSGPLIFGKSTEVVFDLPSALECREVTPKDFSKAHPSLMVIEAKFRISARITSGSESELEEFLYLVASPDNQLRFKDYLPNTSLESWVADDEIEITDTTENAKAGQLGANVGYKGIGGGLSRNKSSKKSHSTHYKEIAHRTLVVASGTTDHEHGIFFKLKPSREASLEGAKEFTFLATVPRTWRAGWCTISCAAKAQSKTFLARSKTDTAGVAQSQVGLYLSGDVQATHLAEELGEVQQLYAEELNGQLADGGFLETMYEAATSGQIASMCGVFKVIPSYKKSASEERLLEEAHNAVVGVQERLRILSE